MLSGAKHLLFSLKTNKKQILRGVYPELIRFAQDRSKWSERGSG